MTYGEAVEKAANALVYSLPKGKRLVYADRVIVARAVLNVIEFKGFEDE
jgi:hypothetical protein